MRLKLVASKTVQFALDKACVITATNKNKAYSLHIVSRLSHKEYDKKDKITC